MSIDLMPPSPSPQTKRIAERINAIREAYLNGTIGDLENPPGSCDPNIRTKRRTKRQARMRLRKLRGWR